MRSDRGDGGREEREYVKFQEGNLIGFICTLCRRMLDDKRSGREKGMGRMIEGREGGREERVFIFILCR